MSTVGTPFAGGSADTSDDARAFQDQVYRRMTAGDRMAIVFRLNQMAREAALSGIRSRHPKYSEREALQALYRLLLGDDLTRRAWPDRQLVAP
jgi:hypothetical protein